MDILRFARFCERIGFKVAGGLALIFLILALAIMTGSIEFEKPSVVLFGIGSLAFLAFMIGSSPNPPLYGDPRD